MLLQVIIFALFALVAAAPQSQQQPRQIVPAPANLAQQEQGVAPEGAKDLQGSQSIGYGYYGGYPLGGYYSSAYYGGYPSFGYGGK